MRAPPRHAAYKASIVWLSLRDAKLRMGHEEPCVQLVADAWQRTCKEVLQDVAIHRQQHRERVSKAAAQQSRRVQ